MAINTLCGRLLNGQDATCEAPARRYFQQAVIINKDSIDPASVTINMPTDATCRYSVTFALKEGETGYRFMGPQGGSAFFGSFSKSRSDLGFPQYAHSVQLLLVGASEEAKCIIDALDKGSYVVALQLMDGTVEIYGFQNGLSTGDYDFNLQDGGGGAPITLTSMDSSPESRLPLVYVTDPAGSEGVDFDDNFANIVG